ncbi:MAG: glucosaminidase domain-containing protein [Candidatus Levybacteria bacterium]|nr:glucosaminidase domain-containing protein [Candidatus Levybacteria bacterium]
MKTKIIFSFLAFIFFLNIPLRSADAAQAKSESANLVTLKKDNNFDNRAKILKAFLNSYNSPLADYSDTFVKSADNNKIDWKLLVAISGVESTFGQEIPYNSYNGWGWGIYGDNMIRFSSWDEAIETISKSIREKYINQWGAKDVYEIGRFYAASPTWAQRVNYFMEKINQFEYSNPKKVLSITL